VSATLADARGKWLFDPTHGDAASEWALGGWDGRAVTHIAVDRTFVAEGVRWIVDFKTGSHEGADRDAFLDREQERYRGTARAVRGIRARARSASDPARPLLSPFAWLARMGVRRIGSCVAEPGICRKIRRKCAKIHSFLVTGTLVQVFRGLPPAADAPVALTIGNFDGVHRGHQAMLNRLVEAAEDLALPSAVMTFDPPPREFFAKASAPPRLSSARDKIERFAAHGVARTYVARFDARLASLDPEAFIESVLIRRLGVRWVLVGEDFRFGKGRAGDLATLRASARTFSVEAMRTVAIEGERASSTAVRGALAAGDLARARALLGRGFTIWGRVGHGAKLGRRLGFPTANIVQKAEAPVAGIFAVRVHGLGTAPRAGVASVGVRPTVAADGVPVLEVFIFDFDAPIYGCRIGIEFMHKLRDEERYPDLDTLARPDRQRRRASARLFQHDCGNAALTQSPTHREERVGAPHA
jgi:riboflavin kinase/FMN adenylyltransferase